METRAVWGLMCAGLLSLPEVAHARELANVRMPDEVEVGSRQLALRYMALKEKLWFDVYVWGLYLEDAPATGGSGTDGDEPQVQDAPEVRAADGAALPAAERAKRLSFHLKRNLKRHQLVEGIRDALGSCEALRPPEMRAKLDQLIGVLDDVRRGDELVITYVPGEGTRVTGGGVREEVFIPGRDFADALFSAWMQQNRLREL